MSEPRNVRSLFHVNINCTDLAKSVAFYEQLGFTKSLDQGTFIGEADKSYEALGIHGHVEHRGPVVLFLGDNLLQTRLDLMEWILPASPPVEKRTAQFVGIPRIALRAKNLTELYERLVAEGMVFVTPPQGPFVDRAIQTILCLRDPDGLLVELMEFMPNGRSLYDSSG